ncbi:MAG: HD domain-containing phosphohydrolase [Thermoleophilaceae bacterium]
MLSEGAPLGLLDAVDSRRYLPHAMLATVAVVIAPAVLVISLTPLGGLTDVALSTLLAVGLSVATGSAGSMVWARTPASSEMPFGDLMLWTWARRVWRERRVAAAPDVAGGARRLSALERLTVVLEAASDRTHGHSARVKRHAHRVARQMRLPEEEVARVRAAASVHDVGKMGIPRATLLCEGIPTEDERGLIELHVTRGAQMVAEAGDPELATIVRHHHERFDGGGYPDGLAGDEIPLGARILAVADAFDHLACDGFAGAARNSVDALSERAGSELDPAVVSAFATYYSGRRSIAGAAMVATAPQRAARWLTAAPSAIGSGAAPPLAQSACAAGVAAIAGICLAGAPAGGGGEGRSGEPASQRPAGGVAVRDGAGAQVAGARPAGRDRGLPGRTVAQAPASGRPPSPSGDGQGPASPEVPATGSPAPPAPTSAGPRAAERTPSVGADAIEPVSLLEPVAPSTPSQPIVDAVEDVVEAVEPLPVLKLAPTVDGLLP